MYLITILVTRCTWQVLSSAQLPTLVCACQFLLTTVNFVLSCAACCLMLETIFRRCIVLDVRFSRHASWCLPVNRSISWLLKCPIIKHKSQAEISMPQGLYLYCAYDSKIYKDTHVLMVQGPTDAALLRHCSWKTISSS